MLKKIKHLCTFHLEMRMYSRDLLIKVKNFLINITKFGKKLAILSKNNNDYKEYNKKLLKFRKE